MLILIVIFLFSCNSPMQQRNPATVGENYKNNENLELKRVQSNSSFSNSNIDFTVCGDCFVQLERDYDSCRDSCDAIPPREDHVIAELPLGGITRILTLSQCCHERCDRDHSAEYNRCQLETNACMEGENSVCPQYCIGDTTGKRPLGYIECDACLDNAPERFCELRGLLGQVEEGNIYCYPPDPSYALPAPIFHNECSENYNPENSPENSSSSSDTIP